VQAGRAWLLAGLTAVLRVPSALVPREPNYVINPAHPDALRIRVADPVPLDWDVRLFRGRSSR
jgi:RES domain-containing protein